MYSKLIGNLIFQKSNMNPTYTYKTVVHLTSKMGKSAAFLRIKTDVLTITKAIPAGKVTTYHSIGDYLYVVSRHVAYILTTLKDEEKHLVPWHRVVAKGGVISAPNSYRARIQIEELKIEGIQFMNKNTIADFEEVFAETDVFAEGLNVTRILKGSQSELLRDFQKIKLDFYHHGQTSRYLHELSRLNLSVKYLDHLKPLDEL